MPIPAGHARTPAILGFVGLCYWGSLAASFACLPPLMLLRECAEHPELQGTNCKDHGGNALLGKLYDDCQKRASTKMNLLLVVPSVAGFVTCPGVGLMSDICGRKAVLALTIFSRRSASYGGRF